MNTIPDFLTHLNRDRRGLPVPYVNAWGPENPGRLYVAHDIHVNQRAIFADETGELIPDFTRQNMARQRRCVRLALCQVCGEDTGWPKLAVVGDHRTAIWDGQPVLLVGEPLLCAPCADFALTTCPSLIRRRTTKEISLVVVDSPDQYALDLSSGWAEGPIETETRGNPAAMWCYLMLPIGAAPIPPGQPPGGG